MSHPLTNKESGQVNTAFQNFLSNAKAAGQKVGNAPQQTKRLAALRKTAKNRKGRHR